MNITIEKLQNLDYAQLALFGDPSNETTWYWAKESQYLRNGIPDRCLGTAHQIYVASTGYDAGLFWEMETEEGEDGYEEECQAREDWEKEVYDIVLPSQENY